MFDIAWIHPVVVHFSIALYTASIFMDVTGVIFNKSNLHTAAWYNLIIAAVAVILSVITGLISKNQLQFNQAAAETLGTHETLAFFATGCIIALGLWRIGLRGKLPNKNRPVYFLVGIMGLILILTGGFYGGKLVYHHGVAVEKHQLNREKLQNPRTSKENNNLLKKDTLR